MLNTTLLVLAAAGVVIAAAVTAVVVTRRRRAARLARLAGVERAALEVDVDALAESVGYLARGVLSADMSRANVVRHPYRWSSLHKLTEEDLREIPAPIPSSDVPRFGYGLPVPRPAIDDTAVFYASHLGSSPDPAPSTSTTPSADTGSSGGGD